MAAGIEEEETADAREGTAVHHVAATMLSRMVDDRHPATAGEYVDTHAPNGVVISEEMADAAYLYYREIMDIAGKGHLNELHVERKVLCQTIHEYCWGTPDATLWLQDALTLHVWDFKYGHRRVRAFENWQCMTYAVGKLDEITNGQALAPSPIKVIVHIVQPRCFDGLGSVDTWEIKAEELRAYMNIMSAACNEAISATPRVIAGEHCRDCPARTRCPSSLKMSTVLADYASLASPVNLSTEAMAYELRVLKHAADLLDHRISALETELTGKAKGGESIPGWRLENTFGRAQWTVPPKDVFSIGDLMGVNLRQEEKPITPNQAKTALKKANVDPSVITGYYQSLPSGAKLVEDDGTRARLIFKQEIPQ